MTEQESLKLRYICGWNDLEYGINHWPFSTSKWMHPLHWANYMKELAEKMINEMPAIHTPYQAGIIEAAKFYSEHGHITRR